MKITVSPVVTGKSLLTGLKPGEQGKVEALLFPERPVTRRLISLGLLPGEIIVLEQDYPEYLIRFGFTRVALNRKVARMIVVHKLASFPGKR